MKMNPWKPNIMMMPDGDAGGGTVGGTATSTTTTQTTDAGAGGGEAKTTVAEGKTLLTTPPATSTAQDWRASLPDDLKGDPSIKDIKSVEDLVKSHKNAQSFVGADKMVVPKADAKPEEWEAVYNRLGRPASADKYVLENKVELPKGMTENADLKKGMAASFHKAGLNQKQVDMLYADYNGLVGGIFAGRDEAVQADMSKRQEELKKEWKGAEFNENVDKARIAIVHFGGDDFLKLMDDTGLGNEPLMLRFCANVAKAMSEDRIMGKGGSDMRFGGMNVEQAKVRIAEIKKDPNFLAKDKNKDLVAEMGRLQLIVSGGK